MAPVAGICGLSEEVTLAVLPRLFYEELQTELNRRGMNMDSSTLDKRDLVSLLQDLMVEEYFTLQTLVDPPSLQNSGTSPRGVEVSKDGFGFPGTEIEPKNIASVVQIKQEVEDSFPMYATCIGSERADIGTLLTATETLEQFEDTSEVGLHATDEINVKTEKSDDEIYDHFGCTDLAFKILPQENAYQDIVDENHKKGLRRCPHCAYTTVHATTMKRHMFTHTGEKPFACSLCSYTTSRKYSLDHHMNNHADWEKDSLQKDANTIGAPASGKKMEARKNAKQKCYFCPFTSGTKKSMTRHLAEKHARQHSLQERNHQHDTAANNCNSSVSNNRAFLETVDSFDNQTGLEYGATSPVASNEMPQTSECNSVHNSTTGSGAKQEVLSCPLCKYTSRLVKQMEQHVRSHTAKGPFKCPECSFLAVERSELFLHIETHIKNGRFSCQVCGYRAATCGGLTRHRMSQHLGKGDNCSSLDEGIQSGMSTGSEKTTLECRKCSYCTTNRSRFEEHVKMQHKSPGRFTCQVCGFWAVNRAGLQKHMKLHKGKGSGTAGSQEVVVPDGSPLQVELVSYRYDDQMSSDKRGRDTESKDMTVPNHKVTVPSEKPFADIAASKQAVSIETEEKTEENVATVQQKGGKPYVCGECGYRVATRSTLFTHMKKHQGRKVYNCQICGLQPSSHKDFILHMRTHTGEKPFKCPQCTLSFARKQNLKRHLQVHERQ
ncbi:oocyte zinc finger protein XlCOF7.1-like isoform X2 [Branchiostoma lanceolatum]